MKFCENCSAWMDSNGTIKVYRPLITAHVLALVCLVRWLISSSGSYPEMRHKSKSVNNLLSGCLLINPCRAADVEFYRNNNNGRDFMGINLSFSDIKSHVDVDYSECSKVP